ncbi:MAG: radical SAM protein [Candidatus Diapherotrites archaeon]|nr:radical SAM protein [Candidatus Diapherotrites archaeon]
MEWPLTFQCNNDCISCIFDTRQIKNMGAPFTKEIKNTIDNVPAGETLCLTGGEPTLRKDFFEIVQYALKKRPNELLFIVSNGRLFSKKRFAEKFKKLSRQNLRIGIPLYSHDPKIHDLITQRKGSWKETVQGIENLAENGVKVELRILMEALNYKDLKETAEFISRKFQNIERIVLINLKYSGNAFINRGDVFVKCSEVAPFVEEVALILMKKGFEVKLFHFPLCTIRSDFWEMAKGTTKNTAELAFAAQCRDCRMKKECPMIWKTYLAIAGGSEFQPIRTASQAKAKK